MPMATVTSKLYGLSNSYSKICNVNSVDGGLSRSLSFFMGKRDVYLKMEEIKVTSKKKAVVLLRGTAQKLT